MWIKNAFRVFSASQTTSCICATYSAHQGVEHDDMNVLCIGARIIGVELALEIVRSYLSAHFSDEERHRRRLGKVLDTEKEHTR